MPNPAFVQNLGTATNASHTTVTSLAVSGASVTTGDDILVCLAVDTTTTTGWSVSDGTNSYSADFGPTNPFTHLSYAVFRAHNCTLSGGTITATIPSANFAAMVAVEESNLRASSAIDVTQSATGTSSSPASGSSSNTAGSADLSNGVVFFELGPGAGSSIVETISGTTSGYSAMSSANANGQISGGSTAETVGIFPYYQAGIASGTALSFGATLGHSDNWVALVFGFSPNTTAVTLSGSTTAVTNDRPPALSLLTITPITLSGRTSALTRDTPPAMSVLGPQIHLSGSTNVGTRSVAPTLTFLQPPINYAALSVETDLKNVRTILTAGSGTQLTVMTETFTADGVAVYWTLEQQPDTSTILPTMTANGLPRSITASGSGSTTSSYGLLTLANGIAALATGADGVPPSGTVLTVTYAYLAPILVRLENATAIAAAAALPNWGKLSYQTQSAGASFGEAAADVVGQLQLWSTAITRVKANVTQESSIVGLEEGDAVTFTSNRLGIIALPMVVSQEGVQGASGGGAGATFATLTCEA